MGVYFPNMEMPRCCYECDLCYDCFYCKNLEVSFYAPQDRAFVPDGFDPAKERLPNCTAFNVPSHGDVIDRQKLYENSWDDESLADAVRYAPAIIPADEEENA